MRSFIRSILMVAAVSTPLAALAASSGDVENTQHNPVPCSMSGSEGHAHGMSDQMRYSDQTSSPVTQPQPSEAQAPDELQSRLGGQNGWTTSFDSPG